MDYNSTSTNWLDAATATWPECHDFLKRHPFAILPMGATEQHGVHLPQNTDTILAETLAFHVAQRSSGLVLSALPIGYSWVWRDYAGALTLSFDTFRAVIKDIARSFKRNACRALLIITAHGANREPMNFHAEEFETSLMLYLRPELGRMDRAVKEYPPDSMNYELSSLPMGVLSE